MTDKPKTKTKLAISFDVEATGDTPATASCNMLGLVGVLEDAVPSLTEKWVLFKKRWCIKEYNGRGERCMREFWDKHLDNLEYIISHAIDPYQVAQELSDFLSELSKEYKWYFVANPASFDWAWLSHFYDKFGPDNKTYLGYKAICMDGMEKSLGFMGYSDDYINKLMDPPKEYGLRMSHLADDDAEYQAYGYLRLVQKLKSLRTDYVLQYLDNSSAECYISDMKFGNREEAEDYVIKSPIGQECISRGMTAENISLELEMHGSFPVEGSQYCDYTRDFFRLCKIQNDRDKMVQAAKDKFETDLGEWLISEISKPAVKLAEQVTTNPVVNDVDDAEESDFQKSDTQGSATCCNCSEDCCDSLKACDVCKGTLCERCGERGEDTIRLEEWLYSMNLCQKCNKLLCKNCMVICYNCAVSGEGDYLCSNCAPKLTESNICRYHRWFYCSKHEQPTSCSTCGANRNYTSKMG